MSLYLSCRIIFLDSINLKVFLKFVLFLIFSSCNQAKLDQIARAMRGGKTRKQGVKNMSYIIKNGLQLLKFFRRSLLGFTPAKAQLTQRIPPRWDVTVEVLPRPDASNVLCISHGPMPSIFIKT